MTGPYRDDADVLDGAVKWWNDEKGFGFIRTGDGVKDSFVHFSAIIAEGTARRTLTEGQRVRFERRITPKGPCAANVQAL